MEREKTFDRSGKEIIVKDNEGTQVYKGDTVIYYSGGYPKHVARGVIQKINPKSIRVNGNTIFPHRFIKV